MSKTQISVSLDDAVISAIEDLATQERRSRANMFECLIDQALSARKDNEDAHAS